MIPINKADAKADRQRLLFAETIAANKPELEILKTKSAATLRTVRWVKQIFSNARVIA